MAKGKPFSLYLRKNKNTKVYYVQFKNPDGSFRPGISTGQTAKTKAEAWAYEYLSNHGNFYPEARLTFKDFADDFFNFNGKWAMDKKAVGKRLSPRYCLENTRILNSFLIPYFGNYQLTDITKRVIKDFRNYLKTKGYSGSTINHALSCLKMILEYAEEYELIQAVPKIERASNQIENPRGILTPEEIKRLFAIQWEDQRAYVCALLSASTGMRLGEILALTINDVKNDLIPVNKTWNNNLRTVNPTTKTGRPRYIPLPNRVRKELETLIQYNIHGQDGNNFVFFGTTPKAPLDPNMIIKYFKRALHKIGISEQERKQRNIVFHSFRHFFNSLCINNNIPLTKVQQITGHSSIEMSEHYYHLDSMSDIKQLVDDFFVIDQVQVNEYTKH